MLYGDLLTLLTLIRFLLMWVRSYACGEGTIDFRHIAEKLMEINYSGVSIFETTMPENPKDSIIRLIEKLSRLGWQIQTSFLMRYGIE
jgi:sugar phosphate isomerase/epimerase